MFDVLIVGSGPAGVAAAFPLIGAGLRVVMVDGGKGPATPPPAEPFLSARSNDAAQWKWMIGSQYENLRSRDAVSPKLRTPTLGYVFDDFARTNHVEADNFVVAGSLAVGGLSNAWGAGVARLSGEELADFPFPRNDLDDSYKAVGMRVGISGAIADEMTNYFGVDEWAQPPIALDRLHALLLASYSEKARATEKRRFRMGRSRVAVLSAGLGGRTGCTRSGNCLWGCERQAIYNAANDLPALAAHQNFFYESGFVVERIDRNASNWAVQGRNSKLGQPRSVCARRVVLAAGTLATTRLAMLALRLPDTLPLLTSPTAAYLLWLPKALGMSREASFGLGQLSFALETGDGMSAFGSTFSTTGIPVTEFLRHLPFGKRNGIDILSQLLGSCLAGNIFLHGKHSANCVRLTEDGRLSIRGGFREHLPALMIETRNQLRAAFLKLGAIMIPRSFTVGQPGSDIHYAGSLPMRADPRLGECSVAGEVFGLPGVHIADASCLPTLSEKSHTLTIMANADRIGRIMAKSA